MTNIQELISAHSKAEKVLKSAGQVGSELGKQVYVVGGFVRDLFIQNTPKDVDLMIIVDGIEYAEKLEWDLGVKIVISMCII